MKINHHDISPPDQDFGELSPGKDVSTPDFYNKVISSHTLFPKVFICLPALAVYQHTEMEDTSVPICKNPLVKLIDSYQANHSHLIKPTSPSCPGK